MSKFFVKIISSNRIFYEGFCHCLIVPAVDGEMAIMAHHEETIIAVQNGEMRLQKEEDGEWLYAVLGKGFCMTANYRGVSDGNSESGDLHGDWFQFHDLPDPVQFRNRIRLRNHQWLRKYQKDDFLLLPV